MNRWRIYKTGKTVTDEEVVAWAYVEDVKKAITNYECVRDMIGIHFNNEIEE